MIKAAKMIRFLPLVLILLEATFGFELFDVWVNLVMYFVLKELSEYQYDPEPDDEDEDDDGPGKTPEKVEVEV